MKIARLNLLAYGPFTNQQPLVFGDNPGGVALVYGPNEAGKSAARRAISAWLFGFETNTPDNFLHEYKNLLIGGTLIKGNKESLEFHRRKAKKNSLINPNADNQPYPDTILLPFLKGMNRDRFEQVYAIDHAELKTGGEVLQQFRGLAGESLFAASMGISNLNKVLGELEEKAAKLFQKDRRTKTEIRIAITERDNVLKEKRASECSPSKWDKLNRELRKAQKNHSEAIATLRELRTRKTYLERTLNVLEELGQRRALETELQEYKDIGILPENYDKEARQRAEVSIDRTTQQIRKKKDQLESDDGPRAEGERLIIPEALLGQAEVIENLQTRLSEYQGFCTDVPKRGLEQKSSQNEVRRIARDLGIKEDSETLEAVRLTPEREALISDLIQQRQSIDSTLDAGKKNLRSLHQRRDKVRKELAAAPPLRDTSKLRHAVESVRKSGDLSQQVAETARELEELKQDLVAKHAAVGYWNGKLEDIEGFAVPLRSTIEEYADQFKALEDETRRVDESERESNGAIDNARAEITRIQRAREVPTEQTLMEARERRDLGWSLVRTAWLGGNANDKDIAEYCGTQNLADTYEESVEKADRISDQLRSEAEAAAEILQLQGKISEENKKLERFVEARQSLSESRRNLEQRWLYVWSELDVPEPGSPREMREWLDRFEDLRSVAKEVRRVSSRKTIVEGVTAAHVESLAGELELLKEPRPKESEAFDTILDRCASIVDNAAEQQQIRLKLEDRLEQIENDCSVQEADNNAEAKRLVEWNEKWAEAVSALGAQPNLSISEATARVRQLRDLDKHIQNAASLEHRIRTMQDQIEHFETDVKILAEQCDPELVKQPPAQIVGVLSTQLKQAGKDQTRREELTKQCDQLNRDIAALRDEKEEAQTTLEGLCRLANVQSPTELKDAEKSSERKKTIQSKLAELDSRLLKIGRGTSIEALIDETSGKNGDSIEAEIKGLEDEIQSMEEQRDELAGKTRDCQNACESVDGSAAAAEADEKSLALLSRIRDYADQYVRLRLAATLLRQKIEKHRVENQDPMLKQASALFNEITRGSFSGLVVDYDERDQPIIVGKRASATDEIVPVKGFSDGTADQLYLALRLAYLHRCNDDLNSMPLIVDDILVEFDEQRAAAALRIFGDISRQRQVILLTHHDHIRQLARKEIPDELLVEVELKGIETSSSV